MPTLAPYPHYFDLAAPTFLAPSLCDGVLRASNYLGKPSAVQLARLHHPSISCPRAMRRILEGLVRKDALAVIKPIDLNHPSRHMPHLFLDTTASRRHIEQVFGIPFRRPPELPSRDWRFLRHDATLVDELVSFELTARTHNLPFAYESHWDDDGKRIYPKVTVAHNDLIHTLRPQPDKTLFINGHRIILEHDCGEETIEIGNIIRDATIARKHLVYDQLARMGAFDQLGWRKVVSLFIIDGKKGTKESSRKRIRRCVATIPDTVDARRIFFIDRQTFMEAGDDVATLEYLRGDGQVLRLPCFR